jgi:hypothetical protein
MKEIKIKAFVVYGNRKRLSARALDFLDTLSGGRD